MIIKSCKATHAHKWSVLRHAAKRRRMRTVMQEFMFKAAGMISHSGRWVLGLGANDSAYTVFERLYRQLVPERKPSTA